MIPVSSTQQLSLYLDPVKLLKEAQKETFALQCLATNFLFLSRDNEILQNIESGLSNLEEDLKKTSEKFQTLSLNDRREEGNLLIWKIYKIKTLIQEELRTVSNAREKFNLEDFSKRLTKIEIDYISY